MSYKPRPYALVDAERKAAILAGKPSNVPKGECHMCGWRLAPGGLWCSTQCATDYAAERKELTGA